MKTKTTPAQRTAARRQAIETAYVAEVLEARDLVGQLSELIDDLPHPETNDQKLHWGHVGNVTEVKNRLAQLVAFMNGTEE